jgi:hypothetical protein
MKNQMFTGLYTPSIKVVDKHESREFTALACNNGVVLCDKIEGAFLVLRSKEDLEKLKKLKKLLDEIKIIE